MTDQEVGRAVSREIIHTSLDILRYLTTPSCNPPRRAKNLTLTAAAEHLGVWPVRIGEFELGRRPSE